MKLANWMFNKLIAFLTRVLYPGRRITDEATCYKAFRSDIIQNLDLKCERFEFCPEVTAKVFKGSYRFKEVPISYKARTVEEGKKIGWRDAVEAITTLVKYRVRK